MYPVYPCISLYTMQYMRIYEAGDSCFMQMTCEKKSSCVVTFCKVCHLDLRFEKFEVSFISFIIFCMSEPHHLNKCMSHVLLNLFFFQRSSKWRVYWGLGSHHRQLRPYQIMPFMCCEIANGSTFWSATTRPSLSSSDWYGILSLAMLMKKTHCPDKLGAQEKA